MASVAFSAERRAARTSEPPSSRQVRNRVGRIIAFILCILFALVGFVPVFAAVIVRSETVQVWAAKETAELLEREVGTRAEYHVHVKPWPLTVALQDVVIDGDDGRPQMLISRWALTRAFSDMDELERWLNRVTGAKR